MCQTGGRRLHGVCWGEHGGSRRGADHRAGRALKLETWTLDLEKIGIVKFGLMHIWIVV